jgi:hypothetical protein
MTVPKYIRRPRPDHRNRRRLHRTTFGLRQAPCRATMGFACLPLERERVSQCVVQPAHRAGHGEFALSQLETEGALALVQGISEFMC